MEHDSMERYLLEMLDRLGEQRKNKILAWAILISVSVAALYFFFHRNELRSVLLIMRSSKPMDTSTWTPEGVFWTLLILGPFALALLIPLIVFVRWVITSALARGKPVTPNTTFGSAHYGSLSEAEAAGLIGPASFDASLQSYVSLGIPLFPNRQYTKLEPYQPKQGGSAMMLNEAQQERHLLIVAPTGKGKTSSIILPALFFERGHRSIIITDPKGELIRIAGGALLDNHTVYQFAPTKARYSTCYNPLAHIYSMEDAEEFAQCLIANTGVSSELFWNNARRLLLTACTLHLVETQQDPPLSALVDLLCDTPLDTLQDTLQKRPPSLPVRLQEPFSPALLATNALPVLSWLS